MNKVYMITLGIVLISCTSQKSLNLLPMYGHLPKSPSLKQSDSTFISQAIEAHGGAPDTASRFYSELAWKFFSGNQLDIAMKRFNEAWLLDSTNGDVYWGIGSILGRRGAPIETTITYLEKATLLKPKNERLKSNLAYGFGKIAGNEKEKGNKDWIKSEFKSMELFKSIKTFRKEDCDLYLQWWETALLINNWEMVDSAKGRLKISGLMPHNQNWQKKLEAEEMEKRSK
jgi:tetratricopeptide (TPR) repeat protein